MKYGKTFPSQHFTIKRDKGQGTAAFVHEKNDTSSRQLPNDTHRVTAFCILYHRFLA
jgi:hypothetical protein